MSLFKKACAALMLAYLAAALLPSHFDTMTLYDSTRETAPFWVGKAISVADAVLFGIVLYGLQTRRLIYWRLIPALMAAFLLSNFVPTLWTFYQLSLPWLPFVFIGLFMLIGLLVFIAWWRKQKSYFTG